MDLDVISGHIVHAAIMVHTELGPGLLESAYESCLSYELTKMGHDVVRQKVLPVEYRGQIVRTGYRIDLLVDEAVIVELKCVEVISKVHEAQLLTYLRLSGLHLGLILNFNTPRMKNGIRRMVL